MRRRRPDRVRRRQSAQRALGRRRPAASRSGQHSPLPEAPASSSGSAVSVGCGVPGAPVGTTLVTARSPGGGRSASEAVPNSGAAAASPPVSGAGAAPAAASPAAAGDSADAPGADWAAADSAAAAGAASFAELAEVVVELLETASGMTTAATAATAAAAASENSVVRRLAALVRAASARDGEQVQVTYRRRCCGDLRWCGLRHGRQHRTDPILLGPVGGCGPGCLEHRPCGDRAGRCIGIVGEIGQHPGEVLGLLADTA